MVETICALSTPEGRAALGLIRVSGPAALKAAEDLSGLQFGVRIPTLAVLKNKIGEPIDECIITFFQAPNSYTGEDLIEICGHGNPAILREILKAFVSRETFRVAEAGEFTRRALVNGKTSIDKVEALDSVIHAETFKAAQKALQSKLGGLGSQVNSVVHQISELQLALQAQLDFSENEVGSFDVEVFLGRIRPLLKELQSWLLAFENYKQLFDRSVVVLVGSPNVGKSSLFNQLLGIDKAIVHESPGTTRDYIEHPFEMNGFPILLVDTAGIRDSSDPVEALGILRSKQAMERAQIICWVSDSFEEPSADLATKFANRRWIKIASKSDLRNMDQNREGWIPTSSIAGAGLVDLKQMLCPTVKESGEMFLNSGRQAEKVALALAALKGVERLTLGGEYLDFISTRLNEASKALVEIIDQIPPEETLKSIFSRFCIGK